jgi:glycogen operon protein
MTDTAWNAPSARSLGVLMVGDALEEVDERGRPVRGDTLLILLNAHHQEIRFALPAMGPHTSWLRIVDTIAPHVEEKRYPSDAAYPLQGRTLALFVLRPEQRAASPVLTSEAQS